MKISIKDVERECEKGNVMKTVPNIMAISAIRTHEADADWDDLCRIKDTVWARNKQVVQIQPKPEDGASDDEVQLAMKASINSIMMADALIYMPRHEMISDVRLRLEVARALGCAIVSWDEYATSKLTDMF